MKYIKRHITKTLRDRLTNSKCMLLTGARQVGKSTLIKHEFGDFNCVTLDSRIDRLMAHEDPSMFFLNNSAPLFIDEVQKVPEILEELKTILDKSNQRGKYILSGSQNLELLRGMSESLAGRISVAELGCLSLREIYNINFTNPFIPTDNYLNQREATLINYEDIWHNIHRGMYPELYQINREWQDYYQSYVTTYIERDINELIKQDGISFTKFLIAVAARTGQILNYSSIANSVGVSVTTVKTWISILERTGLIYLLQPYSSNVFKRTIKSPKVYFRDTGLASYLTKWTNTDALKNSAMAGCMFETFIINEIIKSFCNAGIDYRFCLYYHRTKDNLKNGHNEIDLLIENNGTLYPIEIKLTASPNVKMASAFKQLDKIHDKKIGNGVIFCMVNKKTYLKENIIALPVEYI